ncbi:tagaturonate reductase [Bifidobacterium biavatii]|uniref:Mannitol dehydrogenase n=1 Tax=Bifidobacterium biavatii DSM 23969 TaxID=1437608 RepID=A0A087A1N1_9BIFI|nr:tagaturonate reductase [Bifidobacterium biavatii]KFI52681.1 mannitol dehydrogenase [Bifidobacterium biavatii DSM 23969]
MSEQQSSQNISTTDITSEATPPQLNARYVLAHRLTTREAATRPIRVIQFGEGNFLRGFVDWMVQLLNEREPSFDGNVAIVQPLAGGRVAALEAQDRLYTVLLDGMLGGRDVQSRTVVDSIGATVNPYTDWERFLALADDPNASVIVSNTTEAGIALNDHDTPDLTPPASFPAKLTLLLERRWRRGLPGFLLLPCELIEANGDALRKAVVECANRFALPDAFIAWIEHDNVFASTLVDRITPGFPRDDAETIWRELGYRDDNMVKAEPFASWVIAGDERVRNAVTERFPVDRLGVGAILVPDVRPYRERKVRLLNAPHTTMALVARLAGFATVGEVVADPRMHAFVEREMNEEIIPVLSLPADELRTFAGQVIERFANPHMRHELDSIALNSAAKYAARVLPIVLENVRRGRGLPRRAVLALAGLLAVYGGFTPVAVAISDVPETLERFRSSAAATHGDVRAYVATVLADRTLWPEDLTAIDGLANLVADDVTAIANGRMQQLIDSLA